MTTTFGVTFGGFAPLGPQIAVAVGAHASELGYGSFWTAEASGPEAFATLAAVGAAAPDLDLGTGILPLQVRSPTVAAMGAATLQALHPDRTVWLGVGVSSPVITERWHGVGYGERPLSQAREYLTVVRGLLEGEAVSYDGEHYRLSGARVGVRLGERRPKLVLAALNPGMLRLAGELADGVLLNYLPASYVPASVDEVRAGERRAERAHGACTIHALVHAGVADREAARDRARRDLWSYAVVDGYAAMFERAGYAEEIARVREARARRDRDGAVAAISERMCDDIDLVGSADEVRDHVRRYADSGVDDVIVLPLPWGANRRAVIDDTLEALTPLIRGDGMPG